MVHTMICCVTTATQVLKIDLMPIAIALDCDDIGILQRWRQTPNKSGVAFGVSTGNRIVAVCDDIRYVDSKMVSTHRTYL